MKNTLIEKNIFKLGKLLMLTLYMNTKSGNTSLILWYATPLFLKGCKKFMPYMKPLTLFNSHVYNNEVLNVTICNKDVTSMLQTL